MLLPQKPLGRAMPGAGTAGSASLGASRHRAVLPRQRESKHPFLPYADNVKVSINTFPEPLLYQASVKGCQGRRKKPH